MSTSKAYVDSMIRGTSWHSSAPATPIVGDCYHDSRTGCGYMYDGAAWVVFSANSSHPSGVPSMVAPTPEQLEKHPALKQAWEEYIIIKKLLGI